MSLAAAGARRGLAVRAARPARRAARAPSWAAREGGDRRGRSGARLGLPGRRVLRPWDYGDPFFQDAAAGRRTTPSRRRCVGARHAGRLARLLRGARRRRSTRSSREATSYPRQTRTSTRSASTIERADDVRVLGNVVPGERWLETMLHELGHARLRRAIDRGLPWLLRTHAHIFTTEAIAMLHGRLARDPLFLRTLSRAFRPSVADAPANRAACAAHLHVLTPWVQVMTRFERALYADPDADLGRPGGISSSATSACGGPTATAARLGRARSTSRWRRSTTTTTCSARCTASQLEWDARARDRLGEPGRRTCARGRVPARALHAARRARCAGTR